MLNANGTQTDESQYITTAAFTATAPTLTSNGTYVVDYNGTISLTFSNGIPAGNYELIARTKESSYPGLQDAAGNPLASDFVYDFSLQTEPVFITDMAMESTYSSNGSTVVGGDRSVLRVAFDRGGLHIPCRGATHGLRARSLEPDSLRRSQRQQLLERRQADRVGQQPDLRS